MVHKSPVLSVFSFPSSFPCHSLGSKSSSRVASFTVVVPVSTVILALGWCLYHLGGFWSQVTWPRPGMVDSPVCLSSLSRFSPPGPMGLLHFPPVCLSWYHVTSSGQWAPSRSDGHHPRLKQRRVGMNFFILVSCSRCRDGPGSYVFHVAKLQDDIGLDP